MAEFRFYCHTPGSYVGLDHYFPDPGVHAREVNASNRAKVFEWCQDEDRPGFFAFHDLGKIGHMFYFTDPDLAVEFRFTWG